MGFPALPFAQKTGLDWSAPPIPQFLMGFFQNFGEVTYCKLSYYYPGCCPLQYDGCCPVHTVALYILLPCTYCCPVHTVALYILLPCTYNAQKMSLIALSRSESSRGFPGRYPLRILFLGKAISIEIPMGFPGMHFGETHGHFYRSIPGKPMGISMYIFYIQCTQHVCDWSAPLPIFLFIKIYLKFICAVVLFIQHIQRISPWFAWRKKKNGKQHAHLTNLKYSKCNI